MYAPASIFFTFETPMTTCVIPTNIKPDPFCALSISTSKSSNEFVINASILFSVFILSVSELKT